MQIHSYSESEHIIHNKSDENCLKIEKSKFSITMNQNSGEELQLEKFKTYKDSETSNSELFHEFIFEKEEKPFQITPYSIDQIQTQIEKKKISSCYDFISDFKYYIHCNMCLTIIAGESN